MNNVTTIGPDLTFYPIFCLRCQTAWISKVIEEPCIYCGSKETIGCLRKIFGKDNMYKENPKTKGSGIMCAIPQTGTCPNKCEDCFFQSGRSYLEPLDENLPNLPEEIDYQIVRVNDGNDSNVDIETVQRKTFRYVHRFYNTAIPRNPDVSVPYVFTVNPGEMTDESFHKLHGRPTNLMFVRFRVNTWNLDFCDDCVKFYSEKEIPVVLTFMAYFSEPDRTPNAMCQDHEKNYIYRKRTLNCYHAITTAAWRKVMQRYQDNKWVHSCGKIEGELGDTHCRFCGNCIREYFATLTRMNGN